MAEPMSDEVEVEVVAVHPDQGTFDHMPEPLPPPPPEPFVVEGTARWRVDVKVDLAALIREFPNEYATVDLSGGYAEWERPMVFLWNYMQEDAGSLILDQRFDTGWDEFEFDERGRWTRERFDELCRVCPEARIGGGG